MAQLEIKGKVLEASFVKRVNRFTALINLNGITEAAHVANSGRMRELLVPEARVVVVEQSKESRKTKFDLVAVYYNDVWVSIDSRVPNRILEQAWKHQSLHHFKGMLEYRREVKVGKSKLDFLLQFTDKTCYVEAKSVTLVKDKTAMFPDAPTERGTRHLMELIELVKEGHRGAVIFIVQREDAVEFTPNFVMDPEFAMALEKAQNNGVGVYAYKCRVNTKVISIEDEIPVRFDYNKN